MRRRSRRVPAPARRIDGGKCDLVVAYDRSALRMAPLVAAVPRQGVPSVLDVVEVSEHLRASRANPIYWDFVAGTRLVAAALRRADRDHERPRGPLPPQGLREHAGSSRHRGMARGPGPPSPLATNASISPTSAPFTDATPPSCSSPSHASCTEAEVPITLDVIGHYEGTERGRTSPAVRRGPGRGPRRAASWARASDAALIDHLAARTGSSSHAGSRRPRSTRFPTRLVEYLRFGRPVFVSDVGDVSRYLIDGREAVLLDPSDPKQAARTIADVAARPDRGAAIGVAGREAGARAFDRSATPRGSSSSRHGCAPEMARMSGRCGWSSCSPSRGIGGAERSMLRLMARAHPHRFECRLVYLARAEPGPRAAAAALKRTLRGAARLEPRRALPPPAAGTRPDVVYLFGRFRTIPWAVAARAGRAYVRSWPPSAPPPTAAATVWARRLDRFLVDAPTSRTREYAAANLRRIVGARGPAVCVVPNGIERRPP